MGWNKKHVHFGHVDENSIQKFDFVYNGEREIESVRSSCGCTATRLKGNTISAEWKVGALGPRRLKKKVKEIRVKFKDGKYDDILKLEAMLQRKLP